jgi:hypothetical protein
LHYREITWLVALEYPPRVDAELAHQEIDP